MEPDGLPIVLNATTRHRLQRRVRVSPIHRQPPNSARWRNRDDARYLVSSTVRINPRRSNQRRCKAELFKAVGRAFLEIFWTLSHPFKVVIYIQFYRCHPAQSHLDPLLNQAIDPLSRLLPHQKTNGWMAAPRMLRSRMRSTRLFEKAGKHWHRGRQQIKGALCGIQRNLMQI